MRPRNCSPVSKRKTRLGVSFFLGSAAHRAAPPFELKCSGTAKPPLRNSPLRSEFTPHLRRGPEGPCYGLGCDLVWSADLEAAAFILFRSSGSEQALYRVLRLFHKSQSTLMFLLRRSSPQPPKAYGLCEYLFSRCLRVIGGGNSALP